MCYREDKNGLTQLGHSILVYLLDSLDALTEAPDKVYVLMHMVNTQNRETAFVAYIERLCAALYSDANWHQNVLAESRRIRAELEADPTKLDMVLW